MLDIVCPSGLKGTVRQLTIREQKEFADDETVATGGLTLALVDKLWQETTELGFYAAGPGGKPKWGDVLQGDIAYIVLAIGVLTHGPKYEFKASCTHCGKSVPWSVDVWDQLPIYDLPPEICAAMAAGTKLFDAKTKDGTPIKFQHLRGSHAAQIAKIQSDHKEEILSRTSAIRIREVAGIEPTDHRARKEWILDLGFGDLAYLQEQYDAASCGVETEIQITCRKCNKEFDVDLQLGYDFLVRKASFAARKQKRTRVSRVGSGRHTNDQN